MSLRQKVLQGMVLEMAALVRRLGRRIIFAKCIRLVGFRRGMLKNWRRLDSPGGQFSGYNGAIEVQPSAGAKREAGRNMVHGFIDAELI